MRPYLWAGNVKKRGFSQRWALKSPRADKTSPIIPTKLNSAYFARSTQPGSFLVHISGNHKQNFPGLIWGNPWPTPYCLRKFQYYQVSFCFFWFVFCQSGIYGKSFSQSFHSPLPRRGHIIDIFHFISSSFFLDWNFYTKASHFLFNNYKRHCFNYSTETNIWKLKNRKI